MGVSINGGTPKWLVNIGDNPIKMDDDWGYPYFRKPPDLFHLDGFINQRPSLGDGHPIILTTINPKKIMSLIFASPNIHYRSDKNFWGTCSDKPGVGGGETLVLYARFMIRK